jgi:hypothetical protein
VFRSPLEVDRAGSTGRRSTAEPRGDGLPDPIPADRGPGLLPRRVSLKLTWVGRLTSRSMAEVDPVAALGRLTGRPLITDTLPDRVRAI